MNPEFKITASIVLFNEDYNVLQKTINSFLSTPIKKKLFLLDNSKKKIAKDYFNNPEIEYIFNDKNLGFGKTHNKILSKIDSDFHLILNPDVAFKPDVIHKLIKELEMNKSCVFISPKIVYPNNKPQYICRKHPTVFDLINRRLNLSKQSIHKNEYRNQDLTEPFSPDFIHGCFMLFKTKDLKDLKGFDERYFLYLEDADISREIDKKQKTKLYFPLVEIMHHHQKGSAKSLKLFYYHITSAIKYFLKWGI